MLVLRSRLQEVRQDDVRHVDLNFNEMSLESNQRQPDARPNLHRTPDPLWNARVPYFPQ